MVWENFVSGGGIRIVVPHGGRSEVVHDGIQCEVHLLWQCNRGRALPSKKNRMTMKFGFSLNFLQPFSHILFVNGFVDKAYTLKNMMQCHKIMQYIFYFIFIMVY